MTNILKVLSFIFFVLGFVLFVSGVVQAIYNFNSIGDLPRYAYICLFGIFIFGIGMVLFRESIYREVYG